MIIEFASLETSQLRRSDMEHRIHCKLKLVIRTVHTTRTEFSRRADMLDCKHFTPLEFLDNYGAKIFAPPIG